MKNLLKSTGLIILFVGLFISCSDLSQKAEKKINELSSKTDKLDSLVNKELKKVNALDSLISKEGAKVKRLDSLINKSTSKIDSIANTKINLLKNLNNK